MPGASNRAWAILVQGLSLYHEFPCAPGSEAWSKMNINCGNGAEAATLGALKIDLEATQG